MGFPSVSALPTALRFLGEFHRDWRSLAITTFLQVARRKLVELLEKLPTDSATLRALEERVHQEVAGCLDQVMIDVVKAAHFSKDVLGSVDLLLELDPNLRLQEREQEVTITLLGGSKHKLKTAYLLRRPPRGPGRPRGRGKRGPSGNGLYPFLAALGIHNRATPALASEVALQVTDSTVDQARSLLARRGIDLNKKRISSMVKSLGSRALKFRDSCILPGFASGLGNVAGARLVFSTDGGRLRTRVQKKRGRKKANGRRGFHAPWKEPKVITIYEITEDGRKLRVDGFRYHDATMGDADEAFKILAGVLRSINAQKAREWIIVADGALWIWNRIEDLVKEVGFSKDKVTEIVDLYHAREKLNEFAKEVKSFSNRQRTIWFNRMKKLLDKGDIETMGVEFALYLEGCNSKERRPLAEYFHKNAARMRYAKFRRMRVPMGSGAVESCVRRLVNLRMKSNGIFWKIENAERLLMLRGQFLAGRWNSFIDQILQPVEFWPTGLTVESR